ncbi:MAG: cytidine deaminase [Clostridiales bacterium]|nr:MAG: cytidine deaminase [Clostridiales bacterium]
MNNRQLLDMAIVAKENAYAPYSGVSVGAALLTTTGEVYCGVNVENASYGATNCAERTAVFKAVSEGHANFAKIAIASNLKDVIMPCGICRQVLLEFASSDIEVIVGDADACQSYMLSDLLPNSFNRCDLKGE